MSGRGNLKLKSRCSFGVVQYSAEENITYIVVKFSGVHYSVVQYSAVQNSSVQYSAVQYSAVQYSAVLPTTGLLMTCYTLYGDMQLG